ncbi:hypothetical protein HBI18_214150 [Parastagonospora nodorum]|nr:hypothetical protein HBI06_166640 [Parastagonospora nodorum]KAH4237279.1 hypothetical protein HBI05_129060 [Parastagonospora nodorum]KAH5712007.1 hypothetical protein HBI18_214150 [Parastagonospora nodorum]
METLLSSVEKVVVIPRDVRQRNLIFAARRERERQAQCTWKHDCGMELVGTHPLLLKHKLQPYIPPTSSTLLLSNPLQPCTPYPTLLSPHHQSSSHPIPPQTPNPAFSPSRRSPIPSTSAPIRFARSILPPYRTITKHKKRLLLLLLPGLHRAQRQGVTAWRWRGRLFLCFALRVGPSERRGGERYTVGFVGFRGQGFGRRVVRVGRVRTEKVRFGKQFCSARVWRCDWV